LTIITRSRRVSKQPSFEVYKTYHKGVHTTGNILLFFLFLTHSTPGYTFISSIIRCRQLQQVLLNYKQNFREKWRYRF